MKHEHISTLEKERQMNHNIEQFHRAQLEEKEYMTMVQDVCTKVRNIIQDKERIQILELGAGSGILSLLVANQLVELSKKGTDITFVISEPDTELLEFASDYVIKNVNDSKEFKKLLDHSKVRFVEIKAQDIRKLDEQFDLIISTEVFHHIPYEIKESCIREINSTLTGNGTIIIGDNFVADKYDYKLDNQLISDHAVIAPKVAKLLKEFWDQLFKDQVWPKSFSKAYSQQQEGLVECKTSLPHLLDIIAESGGVVKELHCYDVSILENGGYAIIESKNYNYLPLHVRTYLNLYKIKQSVGGLQYDPLIAMKEIEDKQKIDLELGVVDLEDKNFDYPNPRLEKVAEESLVDLIESITGGNANIVLGAGSDQLLERLSYLFSDKSFINILPLPAYYSHVEYTKKNGSYIKDFIYDLDKAKGDIIQYINNVKNSEEGWQGVVWLTNPHNPTGLVLSLSELKEIADSALVKKLLLVVDEAYGEFSDKELFSSSSINLINDYPNVLTLRSLSKGTASASIRVGYLVTGDETLAESLRIYLPLFPSSRDSLEKTIGLIKEYKRKTDMVRKISHERKTFFLERLGKAVEFLTEKGLQLSFVKPGGITCMIWIKDDAGDMFDLHKYLENKGISVMSLKNIKGVPSGAIRITMGDQKNTNCFFQALEDIK